MINRDELIVLFFMLLAFIFGYKAAEISQAPAAIVEGAK